MFISGVVMYIYELVNYCDSKYNRIDRCDKCENECRNNCEKCLDDIHFNRIIRRYNCNNIVNYYVCKYIFKYSCEIDYLFQRNNSLNQLSYYNILSIGCGPTSDLYGILNYFQRNNIDNKLNYIGCDLNNIWNEIHEQTKLILNKRGITIRFVYEDIFNIIDYIPLDINIIILQYVISDMVTHKYNVDDFFNNLTDKIIDNMNSNSFIIINDVNHNTQARIYFGKLIYLLRTKGINCGIECYHFHNDNRDYTYPYGNLHNDDRVSPLMSIPRNIIKYNPWNYCTSAQLVIRKR
jgi:hypothetical protein